ncbi:MAG TPA: hypothetical protein VK996_06560 [Ramlibacter sp.]|nr:hypothetical protein [Ramlibacter sp.]
MNRNLKHAVTTGALATAALLAAAVVTSTAAYAQEADFVSTRTRAEVIAEIRTPWPRGNPWSAFYNMNPPNSTATRDQVQGQYVANRDGANAFHGEDSGSVYLMKAQGPVPAGPATAMNAPAR